MSNQYDKLLNCIKEDTKDEKHDFLYRIDDRGVVIEGYIGRKKYLVVPENIDDHPVYKIGDNAFYEDEKLKKITLPNTLRIIGREAFASSSLETAILPNSLLIIEDGAFADSSLKSVNIPDSVSVIGEEAFSGTEITSITIPRLVISIGARAFEQTNITSIKLPSNVKTISEEMFSWCRKLHTVTIEGAKKIETAAFAGCDKLKNINLPDTLTTIEDCAFSDTTIEYMIVPQSVQNIGEYNFPDHSHIAILSDETEFYLGDSGYSDYSLVTLYCNQSNTNARKVAKEYGMNRKTLASFAKESADYYKAFEPEIPFESTPPKVFGEHNYCNTKCEFYAACQANKATCIKEIFDGILSTLSAREEKIIRLVFGIGELKEISINLILQSIGVISLQDSEYIDINSDCLDHDDDSWQVSMLEQFTYIKAKALRKLRHPTRSRILRSTEVALVLLYTGETNYFNLWCAIFGERLESREVNLEYYIEKKRIEDEQRKKDEEELANASAEQLPEIRKKIMARSTMIEDLDLSVRTFHWLKHAGINTVEDLTKMTWDRLIRTRNLGKKSADEVLLKLEQLGFYLKSSEE